MNFFIPSISLISLSLPGFAWSKDFNNSGVTIYLPEIAKLDGALSGDGFSVKFFTLYKFFCFDSFGCPFFFKIRIKCAQDLIHYVYFTEL